MKRLRKPGPYFDLKYAMEDAAMACEKKACTRVSRDLEEKLQAAYRERKITRAQLATLQVIGGRLGLELH